MVSMHNLQVSQNLPKVVLVDVQIRQYRLRLGMAQDASKHLVLFCTFEYLCNPHFLERPSYIRLLEKTVSTENSRI